MFGQVEPKNVKCDNFTLAPNGRMPNSHLPVLVYRAVGQGDDLESFFRHLFKQNHWGGEWALGVYGYHHFHSNAHEVLGVAEGSATLILGGEDGREIEVAKGDVLVLPAGTGHRRTRDSWDFWVVGAYPRGQEEYDEYTNQRMCPNCALRLRAVELPSSDPVYGSEGPLPELWQI